MLIGIPSVSVSNFFFFLLIAAVPLPVTSFTSAIKTMPPNQALPLNGLPMSLNGDVNDKIRVAILGCGMMGQEHISYISGYPNLRIDYLCDPHEPSLSKSCKVLHEFYDSSDDLVAPQLPELLQEENDLLARAHQIDLLVIASPNYLHTEALMQWAQHDLTILVEKPVAVSQAQYDELNRLNNDIGTAARIWVAMEYRYIPAIAKLLQLLPDIGELKMVTIRENRYPFLHKIGDWNRDREKTGDTLVEKCCHFWDLFRLITGMEVQTDKLRSLVQRGLNYQDEANQREVPIIDSAYVVLPFDNEGTSHKATVQTVGCLELCMYAEGSRHQEEIIVTGTKGRLEAYLPENKVYLFQRPNHAQWTDRSVPPPPVTPTIFDCSSVQDVHGIEGFESIPTHGGYHYSSTSVEWYYLLQAIEERRISGEWKPHVSLNDGLAAVHVGLQATQAIVNEK